MNKDQSRKLKSQNFYSPLIFLLLLMQAISSYAFRLQPMMAELSPSGENSSQSFQVENNGKEKVAIQLKITSRSTNSAGEESREPTKDFTIYPEQVSLTANDAKTIRIIYKGPANIEVEKAYRLIATQLPIDFKEEVKTNKPQLNFLFQYIASIYVTPPGAAPKLKIENINYIEPNKIRFEINNTGNAHRLFNGVKVFFKSSDGTKYNLNDTFYKKNNNENLLAKSSRKFEGELIEKPKQKNSLIGELEFTE